jgi:hypothetical protein
VTPSRRRRIFKLKRWDSRPVAGRGVLLCDVIRAKYVVIGQVTAASGHGLPLRLRRHHVRCTPNSCRLAATPKSAALGHKLSLSRDREPHRGAGRCFFATFRSQILAPRSPNAAKSCPPAGVGEISRADSHPTWRTAFLRLTCIFATTTPKPYTTLAISVGCGSSLSPRNVWVTANQSGVQTEVEAFLDCPIFDGTPGSIDN